MKPAGQALAAWPYPRWIAHRGAGKLAPENTLAAFRVGAAHGYRMFECDVKLSADGVPFLLHDDTLNRTTNAEEALGVSLSAVAGDHPWSTLSLLDAGSWHSSGFAGESLPTFEAIARYCRRNGFDLNIEIKPTPGTDYHTGKVVAQHAARLWHGASVPPLLTSFEDRSGRRAASATRITTRPAAGKPVGRLAGDR
jgi:glycerophosphoryl diester phosphodiesterase